MRTSVATVCLSGSLEEKLQACAEAGFDGVELFEADLVTSVLSPEEVRARAARLGLSLDLYQPFRDLVGLPEGRFEEALERLDAKCALMNRLGMELMLVCSTVSEHSIDDDELTVAQLRLAADVAAARGVRLAYEALAWGSHVNTYGHAWELVRRADHPALGTCLDSFHILSRGDDPSGIEDIPGEKIFFVQLADAPQLGMQILPWSRHHRVFPGEGSFDLVTFVGHLLETGYDGPLSLEIFNDVFREADPRVTAVDGLRSLTWLQQRVAGTLAPEDARRAALSGVPKLEPVERIDHVELLTDRPDHVGAVLGALGFRFVGQHRRKAALLYASGQTRVVLTPVTGRGTRIASVAVGVQDACLAAERAVALGATPAHRPTLADEARLPGVHAPGGWELFFVDPRLAGWTEEFAAHAEAALSAPTGARAAKPAGDPGRDADVGLGLDHLNVAVPRTHFDAAVLFLESVLRLRREEPVDVPSRRGLVRSQVLVSPERGIRWVLNMVPASLADSEGAPRDYPAHLAFAVGDAVAAAEALERAGLRPLAIPANYYEDLAARFGVSAHAGRLAAHGLLYDRDARGEFLHLYTESLDGLFLELVERRGDYDGYGPGDAAVRLAAQEVGGR